MELAADVVARILDTADRVRHDLADGRIGALSLLVADALLLEHLFPDGWDRDDLEQLAGRLWMAARVDGAGGRP